VNSDALIHALCADLKPVRRLGSLTVRMLLWSGATLAYVAASSYAWGIRPDLSQALQRPAYMAENACLLLIFVLATRCWLQLGVPGVTRGWVTRALPISIYFVWALLVAVRWAPQAVGQAASLSGASCVYRMSGLTFAPALAAFSMLRNAAPLRPGWSGALALLSSSALAMLGTQVLCAKDDPRHVLLWHVAPVAVAAVLGVWLGNVVLSRGKLTLRGVLRNRQMGGQV
jgi:hypothetical protein